MVQEGKGDWKGGKGKQDRGLEPKTNNLRLIDKLDR